MIVPRHKKFEGAGKKATTKTKVRHPCQLSHTLQCCLPTLPGLFPLTPPPPDLGDLTDAFPRLWLPPPLQKPLSPDSQTQNAVTGGRAGQGFSQVLLAGQSF